MNPVCPVESHTSVVNPIGIELLIDTDKEAMDSKGFAIVEWRKEWRMEI